MSRHLILPLIVCMGIMQTTIAQQLRYEKRIGVQGPASQGEGIYEMLNGDLIVAGTRNTIIAQGDPQDFYLIRTNASGDTLWTKSIGSESYRESADAILRLPNGNMVIAGTSVSFPLGQIFESYIVCTTPLGEVLWEHAYPGIFPRCMRYADDMIFIAGTTLNTSSGTGNAWLMKMNAQGDSLWTGSYGGAYYDDIMDMELTSDKGCLLAGLTYNGFDGNTSNALLIRTDSDGKQKWIKNYGSNVNETDNDIFWSITPSVAGNGSTDGYVLAGGKRADLYFVKMDTAGKVIWDKSMGAGSDMLVGKVVKQAENGGFVIVGTRDVDGLSELFITGTDFSGTPLWDTSYSLNNQTYSPTAFTFTNDGGFAVTGSVFVPTPRQYVFLAKFNGNITGLKHIRMADALLSVYPNPAARQVSLKYDGSAALEKVVIMDMLGRELGLVVNTKGSTSMEIELPACKGFVWLNIYTGNGIMTRKVAVKGE